MPQKPPDQPAVHTADTFVDLTADDQPAVVAHLQSLDERDFHLRFGTSRQPESVKKIANALFQRAHVFGLWDAGHTCLLVLGSYGREPGASVPGTFEVSMSALRESRGGMGRRAAEWLQPRLVAQGAQQVELLFHASNTAVVRLAASMGMKIQFSGGEGVARLDLRPAADAIRDWLDRLDQLLEAVRNEPGGGTTAKL